MEAATGDQRVLPGQIVTVVVTKRKPSACRAAIPSLHIAAAVICLIFNIFLPGIGTIAAGFSLFCCGNPGQSGGGKLGTFCLNFWVGIIQLLTCWVFLLGWIWSIMWGVAFIGLAADYHTPTETTTIVTTSPAIAEPGVNGQLLVVTSKPSGPVTMDDPPGLIRVGHPPPPDYTPDEKPPLEEKNFITRYNNGAPFTIDYGPPPVQ